MAPTKRLLVILDLNGTLLIRPKKASFHLRPHAEPFLDLLFRTCDVGVWSSAMPHNVAPMVKGVFGDRPLYCVLDRSHTVPDRTPGAKPHATIKDLRRVWDQPSAGAEGSAAAASGAASGAASRGAASSPPAPAVRHSETDTVIIDDSTSKLRRQPQNLVLIKEYEKIDPLDKVLLVLSRYFEGVVLRQWEEGAEDVREILRKSPFTGLDLGELPADHPQHIDDLAASLERATLKEKEPSPEKEKK
jgi:hypothetical protein